MPFARTGDPGREHAGSDRGHLGRAPPCDVGHECAGERRLGGDEDTLAHGEGNGVAHEPRSRGGGGPGGDLATERGAWREERPRADVAHIGRDGVADVLGDTRPVHHDDDVGPRRDEGTGVSAHGGEGVHARADLPCQPRRGTKQLTCDLGPARLGEHGDDTPRRRRGGSAGVAVGVATGVGVGPLHIGTWSRPGSERAAPGELVDGLLDLPLDGPVEDEESPRVFHRARRAHDRRAGGVAPRAGAEVGGGDAPQANGVDGGPSLRVNLARVAQALGDRQDRGQRHLDFLAPVVVLELEAQERSDVLNVTDAAGEGKVEQLRQLGSHLPGLPVDGVAAQEDEVERPGRPQGRRQGARRRQGVGARERLVAHVEAAVRAPGDPLAQDVLRARRPERDHRARAAGVACQGDACCDGTAAVGVHLERDTDACESSSLESQRLRQRHLFGQRRDTQCVPRGACHDAPRPRPRAPRRETAVENPVGRGTCNRKERRRSMQVTLLGRPADRGPTRLSSRPRRPRDCAGPRPPPGAACRRWCAPT